MDVGRIVVVGASIAGLRAVETLRREGFDGEIFLIGAEKHLPYDRPLLSKELLKNQIEVEKSNYHDEAWYRDQRVDVLLGTEVTGLDLRANRLAYAHGSLAFDAAILATGSRARTLNWGEPLDGVFTLRTLDDALALRDRLVPGARLVIVGAGFIGAEVAASARAHGLDVTVIESAPAPLMRALGAEMGSALGSLHGKNGALLRCGVGVAGVSGRNKVEQVELSDGTALQADVVVVGAGIVPNVEWLSTSGLRIENGVACDRFLNTGAERIFAAGDVARVDHAWLGRNERGEQWTTAAEQGQLAAVNLLAGRQGQRPYEAVPYFWSDQYGVRIQSAGETSAGEMRPIIGSIHEPPFVGLYTRDERVVGVLSVNAPRQFAKVRKLLPGKPPYDEVSAALLN